LSLSGQAHHHKIHHHQSEGAERQNHRVHLLGLAEADKNHDKEMDGVINSFRASLAKNGA